MPRIEEGVGYKAGVPALEAARDQASRVLIIRGLVLEALEQARSPLSADEIADLIEVDFISVRPRVSELHSRGLVRDSGTRRPSRSGRLVTGWEIATPILAGDPQ